MVPKFRLLMCPSVRKQNYFTPAARAVQALSYTFFVLEVEVQGEKFPSPSVLVSHGLSEADHLEQTPSGDRRVPDE